MMSSLACGHKYVKMPTLAKSQKLKDDKILLYLTKLANSEFRGYSTKQLAARLSSIEARRYLTTLIVMNSQEKSNFNDIEEASSNREVSQNVSSKNEKGSAQFNSLNGSGFKKISINRHLCDILSEIKYSSDEDQS